MTRLESKAPQVEPAEPQDEAGFKTGRMPMLLGLLSAAALALTGLWFLLSHGDQARVYGELGRKINGVRQSQFDQFWSCALSGVDPHVLRDNTELTSELDVLAADGGNTYATYLREHCADKLTEIAPQLDQLIVPDDLKRDVDSMKAATRQLQQNLGSFISCLSAPQPCDRVAAKPSLDGIARGWFDFQTAHASINRTLRAKLENP